MSKKSFAVTTLFGMVSFPIASRKLNVVVVSIVVRTTNVVIDKVKIVIPINGNLYMNNTRDALATSVV